MPGPNTPPIPYASATQSGRVSTGAQSFAGVKTFTSAPIIPNLSGTNTGDQTSTASMADSTDRRYVTDAQRTVIGNTSGTNSGDVSLAAFGSAPSANGATLAGQVLTLQPADGTRPGLLSILAQIIAGAKTFAATLFSTVASGGVAISLLDGARFNLSTADLSSYLYRISSNVIGTPGHFQPAQIDLASGAVLFEFSGTCMRGNVADGAGAIANKFGNNPTLTNAAAKIAGWYSDNVSTLKACVFASGAFASVGTDGSSTAGAQTIDKPSGKGKIASGATSCVITNSTAAVGDIVEINWEGDHGAARSWAVAAAGSFTVTLSGAASGATVFSFAIKKII